MPTRARLPAFALLLALLVPVRLLADTITGTVKDPSGAVVASASIEITGENLPQPIMLSSDADGKFASTDLKPGKYTLRVIRDGFDPLVNTVDLHGTAELTLTLVLAAQKTKVVVTEKNLALANSDPVYVQLRNIGLGETRRCEDFTLEWDVATFQFKSGTFTLLQPVNGVVTGAVFIGQGHFTLKAVGGIDARELARRTGGGDAQDDFTEVIFRFTPDARAKLAPGLLNQADTPPEAAEAFKRWQKRVREDRGIPVGLSQVLLEGDARDNVDADVLAALYNPAHPPFFNAYIRGAKHKDLRFFWRVRVGAIPDLDSPEEVALVNFNPEGSDDGIWYLTHLKTELLARTANSLEDRRLFATHHYKIETVIGKNDHLFSVATITFEPLVAGERLMKFQLLPNLRVARVSDESGDALHFIQEGFKQDGSFYAILNSAPPIGKEHSITVEYVGDKVVTKAGEGSFYIGSRESWYPNLNGFGEFSLFDLTFKVPKRYTLISVGQLQSSSMEQDFAVTHWLTPNPVAVAGFNYGDYKKIDLADTVTGYRISGYYLSDLPDVLIPYREKAHLGNMSLTAMTKYALEQTRAQLQICTSYFGKIPYQDVYITEQPNFNFGQSWPDLVYLPISAYIDSTQRWMLFNRIDDNFTGFVREVTPHEVAHQWWGHAVGWASYHDQWLSEGFAEFSAALFLQQAFAKDWKKDYLDFWERQRKRILEKNNWGVSPNDAGPIWLGLRLVSPHSPNAYQGDTYAKGAYILQMLRSMMYSDTDADHEAAFTAMMHDFTETYRLKPASTEAFKAIAERHMTKIMNLQGNGRLDWFFNEWVYGTYVPRYHLDYQVMPADAGKVKLRMVVTQSEVDSNFGMLVPAFADFGEGMVRLGQFTMVGNSTRTIDVILPKQPKKVVLNAFKDVLER
jgi:Carboxypeptidase regulatory-like domain/Peptidase family M1 domain